MSVNIRQIALKAGVSTASVSRTLNDPDTPKVSQEVKNRILKICEELQYRPNIHAIRMISGKSRCVAFLMPPFSQEDVKSGNWNISDAILSSAISGVEMELSANSYYLTLVSINERFIKNKEYLKLFRGRIVDGVIIWGWLNSESYIHQLIKDKVPLVMLQCASPTLPVSQVVAQDYEGMGMIADHLVSLGHRKISFISPPLGASVGQDRYLGFIDGLKRHGLKPIYISGNSKYTFDVGYAGGLEILRKHPETTAIAASNDVVALGVMKAAKEMGRKVPEDLSVTGADGIFTHGLIKLTTYFSPSCKIGENGASLLLKIMNEKSAKRKVIRMEVEFIKGETTAVAQP